LQSQYGGTSHATTYPHHPFLPQASTFRQVVVTLNGRDFYLGPHETQASKREYDRLIGEWLQHGRQFSPDPEGQGSLAVVQLIVAYLHFARDYYRKDGKPTSESKSIVYALRYVKLLYGRKPVQDFGPVALQAIRN
jgi:hypothetical protein